MNNISEKEILNDMLLSEKYIINNYNNYINECSSATIRDKFLNILSEEHHIHSEIFSQMKKRGWYKTEEIPKEKLSEIVSNLKEKTAS